MIARSQQMKSLSVAMPFSLLSEDSDLGPISDQVDHLTAQPCVSRVLILHRNAEDEKIARRIRPANGKLNFIQIHSWISGKDMMRILNATDADGLLLNLYGANLGFERRGLEEFLAVAEISGAGLVYSDSRQVVGAEIIERPKINYQSGSLRESFDFGPAVLVSKRAAEEAVRRHGPIAQDTRWGGFYDLRLRLSIDYPIVRVAEPLYVERGSLNQPSKTAHGGSGPPFYMPNRNGREYQVESERIVTDHLSRMGAYVESGSCPPPISRDNFPVTASIIMPTRNRERTIADAIESALDQSTSFDYNLIVVDDHSTDRTSEIVQQFSRRHENIVHTIPDRADLGVGGMWNEAIYSRHCGLYAVQLDSDDVYAHNSAVELMVNEFMRADSPDAASGRNAPRYAMVVGSYTFVNFDLQEIAPGLNQRLELSRENGRNNMLCIEGPGAPRAFYVPVLRRFGFPNVSFGEDYAVALRISREYDIGRVFESLYLARQWEDNTYRSLPLGSVKSISLKDIFPYGVDPQEFLRRMRPITAAIAMASGNRNNTYKDYLRTVEIQARINNHPRR
jgi:glycosyltransferase involved in cell wall biosynthesis